MPTIPVYDHVMSQSLATLRDRRELAILQLSDAYANDLIDVDELDRRLDLAHGAKTIAELDSLVADLATSTALVPVGSHAIDDPKRAETTKLRVIMGTVERRSRWTVPRKLNVRVMWGNAELDFREASIAPGVTTIEVRVLMGNLELILPPWLAIDVDASSFAGNVEERHRMSSEVDESQPMLRITGSVWFGNLEISTRLAGETAGDARKRERRERKQLRAATPER
ncbi:MAG: hypothetical protein JWO36_6003 [Myxococcales bacterium]|nr:hypothetical protein [Myxococcales bacterium]